MRIKFKNYRGSVLVNLLVGVSLVSALSLYIANQSTSSQKDARSRELQIETDTFIDELKVVLSSPVNCLNTFSGLDAKNTSAGTVNNIKYHNTSAVTVNRFRTLSADPAIRYGQGALQIESFGLSDSDTDVDVATLGNTKLLITLTGKITNTVKTLTKKINLWVEVDASNNITNCRVQTKSSGAVWSQSPTKINDIFHNAAKVGIGHDSPVVSLDVNGAVKVGYEASSCDIAGADDGTMRRNPVSKCIEFCSQNKWVEIVCGI